VDLVAKPNHLHLYRFASVAIISFDLSARLRENAVIESARED